MAGISLANLTKVYPDGTRAVDEVSLEIPDGQLLVLVGPSGCGKTSLLRMIAGLEDITSGSLRIGGVLVNDVPPKDRDIAMVFQNYALYPHMTVYENMAFGLRLRRERRSSIDHAVRRTAKLLGLEHLLDKKPRLLSGGQRQRVAMGRAIVRQPQVFLMDEPLSNLDAKLRVQMRAEIARLQRELGATMIYVTHDQTEAMTLGDVVVVMRHGVIQQVDSPNSLYRTPRNLFVAGFIGSPPMNVVEATLRRDGGEHRIEFGSSRLPLPEDLIGSRPGIDRYFDRSIVVGIRPEHLLELSAATGEEGAVWGRMTATIDIREDMGSETLLHFAVDAKPPTTEDLRELAVDIDSVELALLEEQAAERRSTFIARLDPECSGTEGDAIELAVDLRRLHFFDPETGVAIPERDTT
jgi:multiple sugar transport system ATP-binding protein